MKKISWLKRMFMSFDQLEQYFKGSGNSDELIELKTKLEGKEQLFIEKEKRVSDLERMFNEKDKDFAILKSELEKLKAANSSKDESIKDYESKLHNYKEKQTELETALRETKDTKEKLQQDINTRLNTLSRIENTFFGTTGNKGKGMLGEKQLENLLSKSGLPKDFWDTNLQVNSNVVEFAIKSGENNKWIPVDSKVLDADIDEEGNIEIDDNFVRKVRSQAKEITKYLGKSNTASYGLLVLQSDEIYMKLYEFNPVFFQEMIRDNKIYVSSPSSFVQFASSISHILSVYQRVNKDEKLYEEIISLLKSVTNFGANIKESYVKLKTAIENHYPTIENKQSKIAAKLDDKIEQLAQLEDKKKYK